MFVLFDAWLGYRSALQTTQSAYDRLLVTAAHALGDMIRLERGELQVTLPHTALELYSTDVRVDVREQPGRSPLLYRVNFLNGDFLAGDAALPPYTGLPPLNDAYASRLQFYDRDMPDGEPARFVALWQPVESDEGMRYVVVQVGDVFAVALTDIPQGETGDGMTEGVFMLPKLKTDDMKTGKKVYLKSGKVQLTNSGSDPLVGVVWADAGTSAEEVPVKLNV